MRRALPVAVRRALPVVVLTALVTSVSGACAAPAPGAGQEEAVMVSVRVTEQGLVAEPDTVAMSTGEQVDLVVRAEEPGELHVHSRPEQVLDFAEGTTTFAMVMDSAGTVVVETHAPDRTVLRLQVGR